MTSRLPGFDPRLFADLAEGARLYELSYAMAPSMPVYHQHIPYSLALHRRHGDPHQPSGRMARALPMRSS